MDACFMMCAHGHEEPNSLVSASTRVSGKILGVVARRR